MREHANISAKSCLSISSAEHYLGDFRRKASFIYYLLDELNLRSFLASLPECNTGSGQMVTNRSAGYLPIYALQAQ